MKIGEIKLEALTLMNVNNESKLTLSNFNAYLNENKYKKYLLNMDESIKRAVDIIVAKNLLREKYEYLSQLNYTKAENYYMLSLSQIADFHKIKKVITINDKIEDLKINYFGNNLVIYSKLNATNIVVIYYPKVIFSNFDLQTELEVPDYLARLIPYFIKYDLYQEDEPNLAIIAKNNFDTLIENYATTVDQSSESEIERIFEV